MASRDADLNDGPYSITAEATDTAGNSATSTARTFTVDTIAPAAPVITSPTDGTTTNADTIDISGTTEDGDTATVEVFSGT
jgi:large repetitive protein